MAEIDSGLLTPGDSLRAPSKLPVEAAIKLFSRLVQDFASG